MCCETALALVVLVGAGSFGFPDQLVVLEAEDTAPAVLETMHSDMVYSGFGLVRPLQGKLAGQGNLWNVPTTLTLEDAIGFVSGLEGCLLAMDAATGTDEREQINGYEAVPGKVYIRFDGDAQAKEDAVQQLNALGFVLDREFSVIRVELWSFLPLEYSISEGIAAVNGVEGVLGASADVLLPGWVCEPGDANGDDVVNILDLVMIRNLLNQDPHSGDNWKADVNRDGKINILDLIYCRNHMIR